MKTTESRVKQNPGSTHEGSYQPDVVEAKWQARWAERHINEPDLDRAARPFYNLMMFPYPSAEGLHVGNMFAFTGADTYGRFKRLQGYDVFEPIGYDAFGIHSENYAIAQGINPGKLIPGTSPISAGSSGGSAACSTGGTSCPPPIPSTTSGPSGSSSSCSRRGRRTRRRRRSTGVPRTRPSWPTSRSSTAAASAATSMVEQRFLEQWFFRITDYADRLLANLDDKSKMDWSESTVLAQRNWLGRSEGAEIDVRHRCRTGCHRRGRGADAATIRVFTTRPDTIFGATFMVLAPEHPLVDAFTTAEHRAEVDAYRKMVAAKDLVSRKVGDREKTGVFTGGYA